MGVACDIYLLQDLFCNQQSYSIKGRTFGFTYFKELEVPFELLNYKTKQSYSEKEFYSISPYLQDIENAENGIEKIIINEETEVEYQGIFELIRDLNIPCTLSMNNGYVFIYSSGYFVRKFVGLTEKYFANSFTVFKKEYKINQIQNICPHTFLDLTELEDVRYVTELGELDNAKLLG